MRTTSSRLAGVTAAAIVALGVLAGCSDDDPPTQGTEPTETPNPEPTDGGTTEPATEPATPAERAATAVERFLEVRDDAYRAGRTDLDKLRRVADGQIFVDVQAFVSQTTNAGVTVTGQYEHALDEPVGRDSSTYLVGDCEDRSGVQERLENGDAVPPATDENGDPLRNPLLTEYVVIKADGGGWKVNDSEIRSDEPC